MEKHKKEKKKLGLSTKIFIALLTGAVCGVLIHYYMPEGYFRDTILINGILYVQPIADVLSAIITIFMALHLHRELALTKQKFLSEKAE